MTSGFAFQSLARRGGVRVFQVVFGKTVATQKQIARGSRLSVSQNAKPPLVDNHLRAG